MNLKDRMKTESRDQRSDQHSDPAIPELEATISKFSSENSILKQKVQELSQEIVELNERIVMLNKSDLQLKEAKEKELSVKKEKEQWKEERGVLQGKIADLNSKIVMSNVSVVKNSIAAKDKAVSELELYKNSSQETIRIKDNLIEAQKKTINLAIDNIKISASNINRAFILMLLLIICASGFHRDFWRNLEYPVYYMNTDPEYITGMIITVLFSVFIGSRIIKKWCPLTIIILIISLFLAVMLSGLLSPAGMYGILIGIPTMYLFADLFLDEAKDETVKKIWHHLKKHFIFKPLHKI